MAGFSFSAVDLLLLVCVLWRTWVQVFTDAHQGECRHIRQINFSPPEYGRYLEGHVLLRFSIGKYQQCEERCLLESDCVSVNIGPLINNKVVCELSNSDHMQHPEDLKPRHGWTFRGTENLCFSSPCLNNGKCLMGYTVKKYSCVCKVGFTGENCERDIDECGNGSHDCNENATCLNTAGHFNCICKAGFTGDGRLCSDCSSSLHRFEKYQDLPTKRSPRVEQFNINGSQFLAFANFKGYKDGYNTDSFIYKMNRSTGKFFLYQAIETTGVRDIEYFTMAGKHYLAVANRQSGATSQLNSVIYQWNGHKFAFFQNIPTVGGTRFNFFKILSEPFLAVTNTDLNNLIIYKWKSNQFEKFQEIATEKSRAFTSFAINNEIFIVVANYHNSQGYSVQSPVFKWSGASFIKLQSLQTYGALDAKSFKINGDTFIAFANVRNQSNYVNIDSFIYKWNGSKFVLFQSIPTRGARAWWPFVMCGQTFLGVANYRDSIQGFNTYSIVYQVSRGQIITYQEILTQGAHDMTSFEYSGHTYLVVANFMNDEGKGNINSTLYKWN